MNFTSKLNISFQVPTVRTEREKIKSTLKQAREEGREVN